MVKNSGLKKRVRAYMETHPDMSYTMALRELTQRRLDQDANRPDRCDPETGYHSMPHKGCILR